MRKTFHASQGKTARRDRSAIRLEGIAFFGILLAAAAFGAGGI